MNNTKPVYYAEIAEKNLKLIVLAALFTCLNVLLSAALKIGIELGGATRIAESVGAIIGFVIVLPICFWKFSRFDAMSKKKFLRMEGFAFDAVRRSLVISWIVTFFFLMGMDMLIQRQFTEIPRGFFIELAISVMLGVFGISFFVLNRGSSDEADGFEVESE